MPTKIYLEFVSVNLFIEMLLCMKNNHNTRNNSGGNA